MNNNDKQALIVGNATIPYRIVIDGDVENALTEYDIINTTYEDFRYVDTNSICIGQFVARTFSGDIKVGGEKLLIEDKDIEVKMGVQVSDSITWYSLGNFLITKPEDNNVKDKISFKAMDYTKKFNKEFDPTLVSFPCTAGELANNVCEQCGVILGSLTFTNSDFIIQNNQYTEKESCRKIMQDIGKLAYSWVRIGWDNKCYIDFEVKKEVDEYNKITNDNYYDLTTQQKVFGPVNRVIVGLSEDVEGENIYVEDSDSIATHGVTELKIYDNYLTYTPELRQSVIESAKKLFGLTYTPVEMNTTGHPWLIGNELIEITDMENNLLYTYPFDRTIEYAGHIKTKLVSKADTKTEVEYKNDGSLENEIRKTRIIVDKQNQKIDLISSNVDENNEKVAQLGITVDNVSTTVGNVETTVENITTTKQTSKGGNHLYLEDAMETSALEYIVEGKSEQETTKGNQLIDFNNYELIDSYTTSTFSNDILTVSNTSGSYKTVKWNILDLAKANPGKTLYFTFEKYDYSNCPAPAVNIRQVLNDNVTYPYLVNSKGYCTAVTIPTDVDNLTEFHIRVMPNNSSTGQAGTLIITKPMLQFGTDKLEYEPYTGGQPSPNPDYPSEIKTVKGIRNLFKVKEEGFISTLVTHTKLSDNSFRMSATRDTATTWTALVDIPINIEDIKPNTTYTFSKKHKIDGTTFNRMGAIRTKINGTYNTLYETDSITFTTPEDLQSLSLVFYIAHTDSTIGTGTIDFEDIMLEEGSIRHSPVPYGSWLEVKDTGKNLFKGFNFEKTSNDITFNYYEDGSISAIGTSTGTAYSMTSDIATNYKFMLKAGTYTLNGGKTNIAVEVVKSDGVSIASTSIYKTFTIDEDTEVFVRLNISKGKTVNEIIKPMLEEGSEPTEYEPYKEQSTLIDMNKPNLFDKNNATLNQYINSNGGEGSENGAYFSDYILLKANTIYSFVNRGTWQSVGIYDINKNYISRQTIKNTYKPTSDCYVRMNGDMNFINEAGVYEGYSPYYELSSIGDTKDTLTIQNGKAYINQKIGKVVLDGSESGWATSGAPVNTGVKAYFLSGIGSQIKAINETNGYSDRFTVISGSSEWNTTEHKNSGYCRFTSNNFYIRISETIAPDLATLKTWLSENPVTVYYLLEEHQTIELGDFPIMLYNNINNVTLMSDLDTTTQITYLRNTPISNDYATNQRVDKTDSDLETTNNSLNQTKQDVENTAIDLHNNYYDKEQINSIITTTEEEITTLKQTVETNTSSTNLQISVIEEQLKNGVTSVKTETGYTFDKNGLNISKTGSEMSSTLDNDGLSVKRDNTEVLTVRSAGVETENLKVRTYFTIGSHTRVEDYGNGTGFFHIGGV